MKVMSVVERLIWITIVIISWLYFGICTQRAPRHWDSMSTEEVDRWIRQALPVGTSRSNVVRFLDREGIERYWKEDDKSSSPNLNELGAIIKSVNHRSHPLINTDIAVTFHFSDDKLASYQSEIRLTGP